MVFVYYPLTQNPHRCFWQSGVKSFNPKNHEESMGMDRWDAMGGGDTPARP